MNNQLQSVDDSTPISMLTVGQLRSIIRSHQGEENSSHEKRLVYGLDGICQLFNCRKSRAQQLKNTTIKDAVSQDGRTIVVDADLALELFSRNTKKLKK